MKTILYYRTIQYGNVREFVIDRQFAHYVWLLTGRKTITRTDRECLTQLSNGEIQWQEVLESTIQKPLTTTP